jgi:hypothetical protein
VQQILDGLTVLFGEAGEVGREAVEVHHDAGEALVVLLEHVAHLTRDGAHVLDDARQVLLPGRAAEHEPQRARDLLEILGDQRHAIEELIEVRGVLGVGERVALPRQPRGRSRRDLDDALAEETAGADGHGGVQRDARRLVVDAQGDPRATGLELDPLHLAHAHAGDQHVGTTLHPRRVVEARRHVTSRGADHAAAPHPQGRVEEEHEGSDEGRAHRKLRTVAHHGGALMV